ncbi:MAG: hypothetical protein HY664_05460 [Chloroflexi bacterium]|nr:hypothetical protein [Chloroflexota bacterium]
MDPEPLTNANWSQITEAIGFLWLFLGSGTAFLGAILLAQAILPSLVISGHTSKRTLKVRPWLYLASLVALTMAGLALVRFIDLAIQVLDSYPRFWI